MPRPKNETARDSTVDAIKTIARQQMAEQGTAGLSLRAIARAMNMTAPAIYNYFHRLEDLITALIVDAFAGLAESMEAAYASHETASFQEQTLAVACAYRQWALDHPADFQLIYGNPIPNYEAPADITVPLARRPLELMTRLVFIAQIEGKIQIPTSYATMPDNIKAYMQTWMQGTVPPEVPAEAIYLILVLWSRMHGMVMLELFGHLSPTVGDVETMYKQEINLFLDTLL